MQKTPPPEGTLQWYAWQAAGECTSGFSYPDEFQGIIAAWMQRLTNDTLEEVQKLYGNRTIEVPVPPPLHPVIDDENT